MKRILLVTITAWAFYGGGAAVLAETVTHFGDGIGSDVPDLLDAVGIGSGNAASETTAELFTVPGTAADTVDVTFTFERDTGGFLFTFGFFSSSAVAGIDPVSDKPAYAAAALAAGTLVFDDNIDDPGAAAGFTLAGGTELGFFLVPNDTIPNVLADVDSFYDPPANSGGIFTNNRSPLFSVSDANPGELDQMLSFVANGVTLFTFEDLTRILGGSSDEDFTDMAFTIDTELVPEPSTFALALLALFGIVSLRGRH